MIKHTRITFLALIVGLLLAAAPASAQWTAINNTTFSTAVTSTTTNQVSLTSVTCTNCTFGRDTWIYADTELMIVTGAYTSGTTNIPVLRGARGTPAAAHTTSVKVFVGPATRFKASDPPIGACLRTNVAYSPWININNGYRWTCDNGNTVYSTQVWRAMVPWAFTASSDPTARLTLPPWLRRPQVDTALARLETAVENLFAW